MANLEQQRLYDLGPFRIDPHERQLLRDGRSIPLTAKAFDTLLVLVRSSGHLVEKSELMKAVWGDCVVEEGNLAVTISMLRKALGDEGQERKYIQTVAKRGYRLVIETHEVEAKPALPALAVPEARDRWPRFFTGYRILKIAALVLVTLAVAAGVMHLRNARGAVPQIRSLAVLPFRTLNPTDHSQDYVGLGIADALITKLGSTGRIVLRPTSAVVKYAGDLSDPLAAGREQKVDAILDGHIQWFPDTVRVTVQLVRVSDGASVWADTFEESPERLFALEDSVAKRIADSLAMDLSGEQKKRMVGQQTENPQAYQLYLRGRYFWNKRTEDGLRRSISYYQQATALDPGYALAYAGLADSYGLLGSYGVEPASQADPRAKEAARKALQLDDSLAEAHASLGMIYFFDEWNWTQADREFQRAITLNPSYAIAHTWYGLNLAALGKFDQGLEQVRRAQDLNPVSLIVDTDVGRILYLSRRYDQAIEAYRKVLDLDPNFARAHTRLGMAYAAKGDTRAAIAEFNQALRLSGPDPYLYGLLGYTQALAGNRTTARRLLNQLLERSHKTYVPPFSMALVCIGLGERSAALDWLQKAYQDHSTLMVYAKTDPLLDPVRSDPRFTALLREMNLP
jgi:DNA-binding winged helix-turn-helix (wHTH) protein/tetratricopeptide (TPR) repeat protein/TolB-like protein